MIPSWAKEKKEEEEEEEEEENATLELLDADQKVTMYE